jgi:hypothetical protein
MHKSCEKRGYFISLPEAFEMHAYPDRELVKELEKTLEKEGYAQTAAQDQLPSKVLPEVWAPEINQICIGIDQLPTGLVRSRLVGSSGNSMSFVWTMSALLIAFRLQGDSLVMPLVTP